MTNKPDTPPVLFVDNPMAPDVFADGATGIFFFGGNIRLTFEALRVNHVSSPGPISRVVIGRLVIPLQGAEALRDMLNDYLPKLRENPEAPPITKKPTLQ